MDGRLQRKGINMRTFSEKLTKEQLAGAIAYAFSTMERFKGDVPPSECKDAIDFLKKNELQTGKLTKQIEVDLKKVNFDEENLEWEEGEGYSGTGSITGFHTLPNGLTYLGISAGGDWEVPLFYILYYDGLKLRGYIPTDGNHWNTDTKTAYGSEDDAGIEDGEAVSDANARKRFWVNSRDDLENMDPDKILEDIIHHIVFTQGRFVVPKGLADIDEVKFKSDTAARFSQSVDNMKDWDAHWNQRCSGNDETFSVGSPVTLAPEPQKTIYKIIEDIKQATRLFVGEIERLEGMPMSQQTLAEAIGVQTHLYCSGTLAQLSKGYKPVEEN
jgi:hypothetical protein